MEKSYLEKLLSEYKSSHQIAEETGKSQTTVRYWLKKYNLKSNAKPGIRTKNYTNCLICDKPTDNGKMYCSNNCKSLAHYKKHGYKNFNDKRYNNKFEAVVYKGSKCSFCGYNKNLSGLSFHHRDPKEKDFNITSLNSKGLLEKHFKELDKCDLLCHNCHQEEHYCINELIENPSKQTVKGRKVRNQLIQLKGGKCEICEYNKCNSSLCFHHIDESTKLFEITNRTCNGYKYEKLVNEANKCQLLCHNCHMELHHPEQTIN